MSDDFAMSDASRAELSLDSLIIILMKAMKLLETQARVVSNGFDELERRARNGENGAREALDNLIAKFERELGNVQSQLWDEDKPLKQVPLYEGMVKLQVILAAAGGAAAGGAAAQP